MDLRSVTSSWNFLIIPVPGDISNEGKDKQNDWSKHDFTLKIVMGALAHPQSFRKAKKLFKFAVFIGYVWKVTLEAGTDGSDHFN